MSPGDEGEDGGLFTLGYYATEREAALAYDRAMLIINPGIGRDELNFDPVESENVTFPPEVLRQILAVRDGRGWLS